MEDQLVRFFVGGLAIVARHRDIDPGGNQCAAQRFDPIAPARIATLYVSEVTRAAEELGLRETDAGANVMLLEPFDPVVFDRTIERDGLRCVAPSQLAVDLLTGPGREPSQGEGILTWMKDNEDAWRS